MSVCNFSHDETALGWKYAKHLWSLTDKTPQYSILYVPLNSPLFQVVCPIPLPFPLSNLFLFSYLLPRNVEGTEQKMSIYSVRWMNLSSQVIIEKYFSPQILISYDLKLVQDLRWTFWIVDHWCALISLRKLSFLVNVNRLDTTQRLSWLALQTKFDSFPSPFNFTQQSASCFLTLLQREEPICLGRIITPTPTLRWLTSELQIDHVKTTAGVQAITER